MVATGLSLALLSAGQAPAATQWSLVMYSDRGDHVGLGQPRTLDSGNSTLNVWSDPGSVTFWINWQSGGPFYHFDIAAPPGKALAPGVYDPGIIDVAGDGRGCNITPGRFEIFDIGFDASGQLQRLWLVFEQHCEGYPYALFGEFRYGEPPSPVTPAIVRWPVTDAGRPGTAVPVVVRPRAAVGGVSITGPHAGEFRISSDQCSGRSFSGSASCNVSVQHVPTEAGTHLANLQVAKSGGGAEAVPLQAFAFGGKTGFAYASDPGDFVGGGGRNAYTPSDVVIWPLWTLDHVRVFIYGVPGSNGNSFLAEFAAAKGEPFTPGTYLGATRWPFHEPGPGLSVTGFGNGCNKLTGHFTVGEIAYNAVGPIARFGATFEQHCEGAVPALRGELSFRVGDTTPLAPWMRIGPITSVPPRGAGTPAAAALTPATGAAKRARLASLTHLAVAPRAFRPSPRRRTASPPRHGTHLRFALDSPAGVRFAVKRGWRRLVPVGKPFTRRFSAGPNSFRFTGRVGGRALKRGRYVVVATPTLDGRRGVAAKARFRVLGR